MARKRTSFAAPRDWPFRFKLACSYALFVLVAAAGLGWLGQRYLSEVPARRMSSNARTVAEMLAAMAAATPSLLWSPRFETQIREVAREADIDLVVFRGDGRVLASPDDSSRYEALWKEGPEMRVARLRGSAELHRPATEGQPERLSLVRPIAVANEFIGFVHATISLEELAGERRTLTWQYGTTASIGVLLALILGGWLARTVTSPLYAIARRCEAISVGRWEKPLELGRGDEFGFVAETMEAMAANLHHQQDKAEQARRQLEQLLELLNDGVMVISGDRRLMFANRQAMFFLHTSDGSPAGKPIEEVCAVLELAEAIEEGGGAVEPQTCDICWSDEKEAERFGRLFFTPLHDAADPKAFLIVIHEVTDIRRFELLRRDFASNVSHELKTPITAIGALLDALTDSGEEMDERTRHAFLQRLENQNQRMLRLVNELLTLSKLETGTRVLEFRRVELWPILQAAEETFHPVAETRGLKLSFSLDDDVPPVWGDAVAVEVMLNSLIDNGLRYTPSGGEVAVKASLEGREVCICVTDTGPGIPRAFQGRIFERFYRVESSRSRQRGGSGLGLAIVKHLADAHHGRVALESAQGRGSRFFVYLPVALKGDCRDGAESSAAPASNVSENLEKSS